MAQVIEYLDKILKTQKMELDFQKIGELVLDFIDDESFMNITGLLTTFIKAFNDTRYWQILKFFTIAMEENHTISRKSDLFQKYKDLRLNKYMGFDDQKMLQDLNTIYLKLDQLKNIFLDSIQFKDIGDEPDMAGFDRAGGKILMERYKDWKLQDPDFAAVPARIENYEDAEKTAKLISRLSSKRIELAEKYPDRAEAANNWIAILGQGNSTKLHLPILLKMKEFFAGFVYYAAGKFHQSKDMKYKMIKKALGIWENLLRSDLSSMPEINQDLTLVSTDFIYLIIGIKFWIFPGI
jgi:hypothetical protein